MRSESIKGGVENFYLAPEMAINASATNSGQGVSIAIDDGA